MPEEQAVLHTLYKGKNPPSASISGMIPLNMVRPGTEVSVHSIRGKDETRRFLESLGFVEDAAVTVITELGGNLIVNVKGTRVAISKAMASRVYAV
ncbi:FeoA family protein [Caproiciproducens galactitolivorans]|uniref:FeoA domain protein n=1 Tax=Caproiciproducens galactitolivorans TaxID=642589 RepID=A0A4Z0YM65_9FIRM|nr:FeoA family protein [Caproiciproducens galactitolivorans]TGJ77762.1 FeoA domain protein [Caproiciproducens galactitolivorans]